MDGPGGGAVSWHDMTDEEGKWSVGNCVDTTEGMSSVKDANGRMVGWWVAWLTLSDLERGNTLYVYGLSI